LLSTSVILVFDSRMAKMFSTLIVASLKRSFAIMGSMMIDREPTTERFNIPELSWKASQYITAIEAATPESFVSLDMLVEGGDIMSTLEKQLAEIDELYKSHDGLFVRDGHLTPRAEFDYEAMLVLSREVLQKLTAHDSVLRTAGLGLAVLQFAEAGRRVAHDPSLLLTSDYDEQTLPKMLAYKSGDVAEQAFETFRWSLQGDIYALPSGRLGYLGCLASTHYDFWSQVRVASSKPQGIHEKAGHLLSLFPAKVAAWDPHSYYGRVSQAVIREDLYIQQMKEFEKTLETGKATAWNPHGNTKDVIPFILEVLDVAMARGYSPHESLQIAAHNSTIIGQLTERRRDGMPIDDWDEDYIATLTKGALRLEDDRELPRLVIDEVKLDKDTHADQLRRQQVRGRVAGTCVARNPVLLKRNGKTHQNILTFSAAMHDLVGIEPSVARQVGDEVYIDPAALTVCYVLFATAINYLH